MTVPYYCIGGNPSSGPVCIQVPERINITVLTDLTEKYASGGMIDPTSNMLSDRVFIYHGINDTLILPGHVRLYTVLIGDCVEYRNQTSARL